MTGFTTSAGWADQPPNKGQPGATEEKVTGTPNNPNGFGAVVSQRASTVHDIGEHASGLGPPARIRIRFPRSVWVSATSCAPTVAWADNFGIADPDPHTAAIIGQIDGNPDTDAEGHPGNPGH